MTPQPDSTASATVNVGGPSASAADNAGAGANAQPVVVGGIEFAASAKEARMKMKKKGDVRQQGANLSLRDKYDLLQRLWNTHTTTQDIIISMLDGKSLCQQLDHRRLNICYLYVLYIQYIKFVACTVSVRWQNRRRIGRIGGVCELKFFSSLYLRK